MAHNTLTRPGGFINGANLLPADVADLDYKAGATIDGVNGGTGGAPFSTIDIQGSGLKLVAPPKFATPIARSIRFSPLEIVRDGASGTPGAVSPTSAQPVVVERVVGSTMRAVVGVKTSTIWFAGGVFTLPLTRLPNGSKLLNLKMYFVCDTTVSALPSPTYPSIDVRRSDMSVGGSSSLRAAGAVSYVLPAGGTILTYQAGVNVVTFVPDAPNATIDVTQYTYFARIVTQATALVGTGIYGPDTILGLEANVLVPNGAFW